MAALSRHASYPIQQSPTAPLFFSRPTSVASDATLFPTKAPPDALRAVKNQDVPHVRRTIIICLDGTGDEYDDDNSNVVKLVACLKKDDPSQLTYYQAGIGTYTGHHHVQQGVSSAFDMALGSGLQVHICDAYTFLMQNYREGDRISLFGFSRGAYTARCLAGMLHKVGLLPPHNAAQLSFAYKFFKDESEYGWKMSAGFKRTFCNDIDIHFMGLWDCVASVGYIPKTLPFSKRENRSVHYFRHALALDEHRAKFKACHWVQRAHDAMPIDDDIIDKRNRMLEKQKLKNEKKDKGFFSHPHGYQSKHHRNLMDAMDRSYTNAPETAVPSKQELGEIKRSSFRSLFRSSSNHSNENKETSETNESNENNETKETKKGINLKKLSSAEERDAKKKQSELEADFDRKEAILEMFQGKEPIDEEDLPDDTDVSEVWFAGAHADVGGGAVKNHTRHQLSRIPLRWMIRQCFECNTGILFSTDALACAGLDVESLYPLYIKPAVPTVGPSPSALERYHAESLHPIEERALALRVKYWKDSPDRSKLPKRFRKLNFEYWPEQVENYFDALAPVNDQLEEKKAWWILEAWPVKYRTQNKNDKWVKKVGMNAGRYRSVRTYDPQLHWTVKLRCEQDRDYKIRVRMAKGAAWDVVA